MSEVRTLEDMRELVRIAETNPVIAFTFLPDVKILLRALGIAAEMLCDAERLHVYDADYFIEEAQAQEEGGE